MKRIVQYILILCLLALLPVEVSLVSADELTANDNRRTPKTLVARNTNQPVAFCDEIAMSDSDPTDCLTYVNSEVGSRVVEDFIPDDDVSYDSAGDTITLTITGYDEYEVGDTFWFKMPSTDDDGAAIVADEIERIQINSLGERSTVTPHLDEFEEHNFSPGDRFRAVYLTEATHYFHLVYIPATVISGQALVGDSRNIPRPTDIATQAELDALNLSDDQNASEVAVTASGFASTGPLSTSDTDVQTALNTLAGNTRIGAFTATDETKLDGIATGAQVNPAEYLVSSTLTPNQLRLTLTDDDGGTTTYDPLDTRSTVDNSYLPTKADGVRNKLERAILNSADTFSSSHNGMFVGVDSSSNIALLNAPVEATRTNVYNQVRDIIVGGANITATDDDTNQTVTLAGQSGGSGGLATVSTDTTITGDGTSGSPLAVANPFTDTDETKLDDINLTRAIAISTRTEATNGGNATPRNTIMQVTQDIVFQQTDLDVFEPGGTTRLQVLDKGDIIVYDEGQTRYERIYDAGENEQDASQVRANTAGFSNNLASLNTGNTASVQQVFTTLDSLTLGVEAPYAVLGLSPTSTTPRTAAQKRADIAAGRIGVQQPDSTNLIFAMPFGSYSGDLNLFIQDSVTISSIERQVGAQPYSTRSLELQRQTDKVFFRGASYHHYKATTAIATTSNSTVNWRFTLATEDVVGDQDALYHKLTDAEETAPTLSGGDNQMTFSVSGGARGFGTTVQSDSTGTFSITDATAGARISGEVEWTGEASSGYEPVVTLQLLRGAVVVDSQVIPYADDDASFSIPITAFSGTAVHSFRLSVTTRGRSGSGTVTVSDLVYHTGEPQIDEHIRHIAESKDADLRKSLTVVDISDDLFAQAAADDVDDGDSVTDDTCTGTQTLCASGGTVTVRHDHNVFWIEILVDEDPDPDSNQVIDIHRSLIGTTAKIFTQNSNNPTLREITRDIAISLQLNEDGTLLTINEVGAGVTTPDDHSQISSVRAIRRVIQ